MQSFDTHDAYETLVEDNCFNEQQANRIVSIVKQATTGEVATKADIAKLDAKLNIKIGEMRTEIETVRTELAKQYTRLILWVTGLFAFITAVVKAFEYLLLS